MARYSSMAVDSSARACSRLADLGIQGAEAEVAVGLERAHAEFLGQGEGLVVVSLRPARPPGARAAPQCRRGGAGHTPRWPRSWCCTGERQRPLGEGVRLLQAAGQQLRLAQGETTERLMLPVSVGNRLFHRLREQRHGVGDAPGQGIRAPKAAAILGNQTGRSAS